MDKMEYCNDMLVRLEELLYHELSGCAAWKVELIGVDFLLSKNIQGATADELIQNCIKEIKAAGLVKDLGYQIGGKGVKLELTMKGCAHLPKEAKLRKDGVQPYICPISNMIMDQLIEKLGYDTTYLARLDIDEKKGECRTLCAVYADADQIGVVCDWREE